MVTNNDRLRMLEDAWDDAPDGAQTLRQSLRSKERAVGDTVAGGSLSSISKNQSSHSYAFGAGNMTSAEVSRAWRDLLNLYDALYAAYSTDEDLIYLEMKSRLRYGCSEFTKDFTGVFCA